MLVGAARFELAAPCTPCRCATGLRHAPTLASIAYQAGGPQGGRLGRPSPTSRSPSLTARFPRGRSPEGGKRRVDGAFPTKRRHQPNSRRKGLSSCSRDTSLLSPSTCTWRTRVNPDWSRPRPKFVSSPPQWYSIGVSPLSGPGRLGQRPTTAGWVQSRKGIYPNVTSGKRVGRRSRSARGQAQPVKVIVENVK